MSWQKISVIVGIIMGIFTIVGGVIGSQKYMEDKYVETNEIVQFEQLITMNQKSIRLNQYRLEQKIVQDRIDRKLDLKDRVELKEYGSPSQDIEKKEKILELDRDIRELERDLENIDKP